MDILISIFNVFIDIFQIPAIILGLVAMVGLLVQRKNFSAVVTGTIKTILGLLILAGGIGILVGALIPFGIMFEYAFNLTGIVPFCEAMVGGIIATVPNVAIATSLIMGFGFIGNIILARVSPFKYIFLTGHMIWIMAASLAWAFHDLGFSLAMNVLFGTIIQSMLMVVLPAIAQPIMRKLTGGDKIAYAHLSTLGVCVSGVVGGKLGNKEHNAEDMKVPKGLDFFRDVAASVSLVMFIIYLIVAFASGPRFISENLSGGQNFLIFTFIQAFTFAAGVLILLQGVRMFLGEIIPAFRGVAIKLIPGSVPALDCPVTFQYGPTSLIIGMVFAFIGSMFGLGFAIVFGLVVPLPTIIGCFFTGGTSAIFGNALGGRRGACIAGFIYGLVLTIPVALFYPLFYNYGVVGLGVASIDAVTTLSLIWLSSVVHPIVGPMILTGIAALAFIAVSVKVAKKQKTLGATVQADE